MSSGAACTGTGSAPPYAHQAGDRFIFKGGDTWPAGCLALSIKTGGSASAIDYYGVDKSWYTGGTWRRPIFDANYANVSYMISASGITYVTIDNLELEHQGIVPFTTYTTAGCGIIFSNIWNGGNAGTTVENVYIHDWAVTSNLNGMHLAICTGGIESAQKIINVETSDANGYSYNNGTKLTGLAGETGGGVNYCTEVKNSSFHDGWQGATTCYSVHDNDIYHIEQNTAANLVGAHTQPIEDNESCATLTGTSMAVYNNAVHDNNSGVNIFVRYFSKIYNNVLWNNVNNYPIRLCVPVSDSSSNVGYVLNNTIDTSGNDEGGTPVGVTGNSSVLGTMYIQNNVIVNGSSSFGISAATQHVSNNYAMSTSEATTYGLTPVNQYAPTSSDSNVTGKGANLTGSCSNSLAALCLDAQGTPWYGGTYQQRPGSTAWTLGAYESGGQLTSRPNPPSGLVATVE